MLIPIERSEIKGDSIYVHAVKLSKTDIELSEMIVDCYNDNKSVAVELFGWYNVYTSHYNYLNYKLSFYAHF